MLRLNRFAIILIFVCFPLQEIKANDDLFTKLKSLPGVYVKKIEPLTGFKEAFVLALVQPVDHSKPHGAKFTQRIYINHLDYSKPIVFETHGYDVPWHKKRELSYLLYANQIIVEHRYFGQSKPKPLEWKHLTTWQAASDHHRIIELIKTIYTGKWISTGRSKGGMAALFHQVYYPNDVQASVVFVSPIILGLADQRFPEHINNLGNPQTQKKIRDFQILCLKREASLLRIAEIKSQSTKYSIGINSAFEWSVIEFQNEYWWKNSDADEIPDSTATDNELFDYLNRLSPLGSFSDRTLKYEEPLHFQQSLELGYEGYDIEHLRPYLNTVENADPSVFAPKETKSSEFRPEVMREVLANLQNEANNIIYLYGENDIYSAAMVKPSDKTNSKVIIAKGLAHQFRINDLTIETQNLILETLKSWISDKKNINN